MRIAIDILSVAKFTDGRIRIAGGGNYAKMLIKYLSRIDLDNNYLIFVPQNTLKEFVVEVENFTFVECSLPSRSASCRFLWEQIALPLVLRTYDIDILYVCSSTNVFFAPCKTIIMISNMAPYCDEAIHVEKIWRSKLRLLALRYLARISSKKAAITLTPSKTAERELHRYGFPAKKREAFCTA